MSKPIAMRMNAEQFDSIKPILEDYGVKKVEYSNVFGYCFVRENIFDQCSYLFLQNNKKHYEIHEQFNAKIFLNSLGIDYEETTEQVERYNIFDKAQQLINDAKQQGVEIEIKEGVIILKQVAR